jgi:uncharacterized protein (DUF2141 family)
MIKRTFLAVFLLTASMGRVFAEDVSFWLEIQGVRQGGGLLYATGYSAARTENGQNSGEDSGPDFSLVLGDSAGTVSGELTVPEGEYFIFVYQDHNGNGKLDTGFLNRPKELIGISNYNGRGIPSRDQLKTPINRSVSRVIIQLISM